jgi:hypothetical protein
VVAQQCILVDPCCVDERAVKCEGAGSGDWTITMVTIKRRPSEYNLLESHVCIWRTVDLAPSGIVGERMKRVSCLKIFI